MKDERHPETESAGKGALRLMGLDVGEKTIGIALSDELGWTAQPYQTLIRKGLGQDLVDIRQLVEEHGVYTIVVGLPMNMNGTLGKQARLVSGFARELEKILNLPVVLWDERLTTVAAQRILIQADLSRKKRKKQVDKIAAALILQGYLDSEKNSGGVSKK